MTQKLHIVVDDEQAIRTMLGRYLTEEGFTVTEARDGISLRKVFDRQPADLVLLDLMLPGEDGLSLARYIRQRSKTPIIMLTGKGDVIDRVAGLESGADDYIGKPFHLREVLARIRTVLRRAQKDVEARPASADLSSDGAHGDSIHTFGEWQIDLLKRELHKASGEPTVLTSGEFELLSAFVRSPNRVLARGQLMDLMKGPNWAANDRAIDAQVVRLRKKIERDPARPELIKTIRGGGYIFAVPVIAGIRGL